MMISANLVTRLPKADTMSLAGAVLQEPLLGNVSMTGRVKVA
jgi:hypothetical protein